MPNTPAASQRPIGYAGPAIFSYGFRPFFLGAAAWATLAVVLWLLQFFGLVSLPTTFTPLDWHIHEMIYGYVAAAVAGFLLTAIPNWTSRPPLNGAPLAGLFVLWVLGRVAIAGSAICGSWFAAVVDISFLVLLALLATAEIVTSKNWRNLRVLIALGVLIAGNIVFHVEAIRQGSADYGIRIGIGALIGLIVLIGGRIIPSFTTNWLKENNPGRLPQPFSRFDALAIGASAFALACWIAAPASTVAGILLMAAGIVQAVREMRWAGDRTLADRLVLILHAAYAFVPIGFLLTGAAILWPAALPISTGLHAWTTGAFGLMTLAVMTRASLGHTGQKLAASLPTQLIYLTAFLAAVARIVASLNGSMVWLLISAAAWVLAFGGFAVSFGPLLIDRPPAPDNRS